MKCFSYNLTDLTTFESPCTEVWLEREALPAFATGFAREILDVVPDLSNKGLCVGIYDQDGEAVSFVPLDTLH
jgi:hypothetical protein